MEPEIQTDYNSKDTNTHFWPGETLFTITNGRVLVWTNGFSSPVYILELSPAQFQKVWDAYPTNQERHNFAFGKP